MKNNIRVRMTITNGTVFAFNVEKRSVDTQEVTLYGNYKDPIAFKREAKKVTGFKQIDVDNIKVESKYFDIPVEEFMKSAKEVDLEKEAAEKKPYTGAKRGPKPKSQKQYGSVENTNDNKPAQTINVEDVKEETEKPKPKSKGKSKESNMANKE